MSWWIMPTTADIGFRAFSDSPEGVLRESSIALQEIQLSEKGLEFLDGHIRNVSEWSISMPENDIERGLVRWLEEIIYQGSVEGRWLVEMESIIGENTIRSQVIWVDSQDVELEIEVKAVTMHDLMVREVKPDESVLGDKGIPTFEGPGWMAQVVLDV